MADLTMTDCTVEDNIVQAAHELDRAMMASGYAQCSAWAVKWGRRLIEAARENVDKGDADEGSLSDARRDADNAEEDAASIRTEIERAINKLDEIATDSDTRDAIDAAASILENAL